MERNFVPNIEDLIPPTNDTAYKRILAIGDIHGNFTKLMTLLEKVSPADDDLVIFLGDYIDRGNEVGEVLEWVMARQNKDNFIFLRGNHEQMMLAVAYGREDKITWLFNGGQTTLQGLSKMKAKDADFVDKFLTFATGLPLYHQMTIGGREYFFCHAGVDSLVPLDKQSESFLLWAREEFFHNYDGDAVIVSGHSPVQAFFEFGDDKPRPIKYPGRNILLTDTGSFLKKGYISCVDIISGEFWQSEPLKF